jgi:hypothetical protein
MHVPLALLPINLIFCMVESPCATPADAAVQDQGKTLDPGWSSPRTRYGAGMTENGFFRGFMRG